MPQMFRPLLTGAGIGALAAGLLAVPALLPAAVADEQPMKTLTSTMQELWSQPIDVANLVKPDFTVEPTVATEILHSGTVRKIGYGRTSFVTIAETATGTYSSDGLSSPHVRYPGIHRNPGGDEPRLAGLKVWAGSAWVTIKSGAGSSFVSVNRFPGGTQLTTDAGSCSIVGDAVYC